MQSSHFSEPVRLSVDRPAMFSVQPRDDSEPDCEVYVFYYTKGIQEKKL